MKTEKMITFDADGNPKEIRFYEDDKLTTRLGIILDKDANFIGLRELDVEEVIPTSWLDWFRRRKAKPSPITISTIDFIGLINWINTIKTIKTIETIENIDLVKEITKIGTIHRAEIQSKLIINNDFETGDFTGWFKTYEGTVGGYASVSTEQKKHGAHSCKFTCPATIVGATVQIDQYQCLRSNWLNELRLWWYGVDPQKFWAGIYYDDGTLDQFTQTSPAWPNPSWACWVISGFTLNKRIFKISFGPAADVVNNGAILYCDLIDWVF